MKLKLHSYSRSCRAATLIEVLTGLAILGSVTVALLLARGNLMEQYSTARLKLEAVAITDQLIADWYARDGIPIDEQGDIDNHKGWSWRTSVKQGTETDGDEDIPASLVKVEVFSRAGSIQDTPLVTIELLVTTVEDLNETDRGAL